ncbi:MAG: hypothetical protein QOG00_1974 [Pyrinomonadaceae bacterium]|nr:hypothetical protein [Pyrinomonadaceae bacterium]MDQ1612043.1 hypothetical protein [Pyrinomonadaceae bacterium]
MTTLRELKEQISSDQKWWLVHFMNFVDDFRRHQDPRTAIAEPFELSDGKMDALLASTAESLCDEAGIEPPEWLAGVPASPEPYFVGGLENLKAISIVESPLRFRIRKVFVLENFLSRV